MTESAEIAPLARPEATIVSPLRYPGGKRRLVGYVAEALRLNGLRPGLFVEPFAGGANVALQLLHDGLVERIALGELDPLVAGFWRTLFAEPDWLIGQIQQVVPTVALWDELRRCTPRDDRERAMVCLVLNRTSFSGILNASAGPIGGRQQRSAHTIECRFAAPTVARRIRRIARMADRVAWVHAGDWAETVGRALAEAPNVCLYLDPPFFRKAERLYRFCFDAAGHARLRDGLLKLRAPYIVSYDPAPEIEALYAAGPGVQHVELLYSATQPDRLVRARELIISNLPQLPAATRIWRSASEWRADRRRGGR